MSKKEPKVAIVHDWLVGYAGGDRVVDAMKRVFPDAVIYTLVYDPKNMPEHFKSYDIRTSWFQKVPFSNRLYKAMLPLMPRAFEAFDLTEYDLVLSSSSSCSKGVIHGGAEFCKQQDKILPVLRFRSKDAAAFVAVWVGRVSLPLAGGIFPVDVKSGQPFVPAQKRKAVLDKVRASLPCVRHFGKIPAACPTADGK